MRKGNNINSCLFGEELVAYVYGELSSDGRARFENHLLDCSGCTAEFADISLSRLGVYEWHRDEFLPLETPQFVIPFAPATTPVEAGNSWIEAFSDFVFSPLRIAFGGGSLALIAVAFGLVYILTSDKNAGEADVGAVPEVVSEVPQLKSPEIVASAEGVPVKIDPTEKQDNRAAIVAPRTPTVVRTKAPARRKQITPITASAQKAPRLGTFAEPEDSSLRLSDLVADIDTKDF